jgi:hypothetical protein
MAICLAATMKPEQPNAEAHGSVSSTMSYEDYPDMIQSKQQSWEADPALEPIGLKVTISLPNKQSLANACL